MSGIDFENIKGAEHSRSTCTPRRTEIFAVILGSLTRDHETYRQLDVSPSRKTTMAAERKAKE